MGFAGARIEITVRWLRLARVGVVGVRVLCREVFCVKCEEAAYALLVCVWGSCTAGVQQLRRNAPDAV